MLNQEDLNKLSKQAVICESQVSGTPVLCAQITAYCPVVLSWHQGLHRNSQLFSQRQTLKKDYIKHLSTR